MEVVDKLLVKKCEKCDICEKNVVSLHRQTNGSTTNNKQKIMEIIENKKIKDKVHVCNGNETYIKFSYYCDAAAWLRTFEDYWADETKIIVQSIEQWNRFYH